jgi:HPt (histidine-containing phosphotransfer) domain-containing protein
MSDTSNDVVYLNEEEGKKRIRNNTELYVKLLTNFKTGTNLDALVSAVDAQDWEKARSEAHTLKGVAANLSLTELYKQSLNVETQIKGDALKTESLESLKNCFAITLTEIDKVITRNARS